MESAPILDLRVRFRAGKVVLGLALVFLLVAFLRPLAPGHDPRLRLAVTLGLGLGVAGSALLASLRGRGTAEQWAFYAFLALSLDGLAQITEGLSWPGWPLTMVLVGAVAVAEPLWTAVGVALLASVLGFSPALHDSAALRPALAAALGYLGLALAVNRALVGEKSRLSATLSELARLRHGIDQLEESEPATRPTPDALTLKQVSEEGRRARQLDRAAELDDALSRLVGVARVALQAHAVLYFEVDRGREVAYLRSFAGPDSVVADAVLPMGSDPFGFVLERGQSFYATDYKRLLWSLGYYKGEVKIGSLIAAPVILGGVVSGVLVADRLEIQSLTGHEPDLLQSFSLIVADAIAHLRASLGREELGAEFKAVYQVSSALAALAQADKVRRLLLRSAKDLVPIEAAAVVMNDESQTRYVVEDASGWAKEFEKREVGLTERTWAAWVLRSAEGPYLLDNVSGHKERMPFLVLDEGASRAESLLAIPLKTPDRTLGAVLLLGRKGSFDAAAHRVLGILANQAAGALSTIALLERIKEFAIRDGLTGLYNRRAFGELLGQAVAREDRQGGKFALILLDIDHFKKLNDTYGHPAGDAALKNLASVLNRHLRKGDQAARFGGEEFAVILPSTDEVGAVQLAERVRLAIEKTQVIFGGAKIVMTASFGLAVWPRHETQIESLLSAADRALYAAKEGGRNRVVSATLILQSQEGPSP